MDTETKLAFFQDIVRSCHNLYFGTYDKDLNPLFSNCPNEIVVNNLFAVCNNDETLLAYAEKHHKPLIITNDLNLLWIGVPEKNGEKLEKIHVLGPFFIDSVATESLEANLRKLKLTPGLIQEVIRFLKELPIISLSRVYEYAIMLHFCIYSERISASDLHYRENELTKSMVDAKPKATETHGTYEAELEMLRMVREGNLNYRSHMDKMVMMGNLGKLSKGDPIRQIKNTLLVCITLFSRAAIEGGLSPETSLTLTDHYFQGVEACSTIPELKELSHTLQEDFIQRVHRYRTRNFSKPIIDCCDYINMNLEEELTLHDLAANLNYSEYYLSRKFKQETKLTVTDYIRRQRLELAKDLLRASSLSIQDISEKLQFCSQSYFAEVFRESVGVSPSVWRESSK